MGISYFWCGGCDCSCIYPGIARLEARDTTAEDPGNEPVDGHEELVPEGHGLGQVGGTPEDPGGPATELVAGTLVDGLPAAEVGHDTPVAELEARGVLDVDDALVGLVEDLGEVGGLLSGDLGGLGEGALALDNGGVAEDEDVTEEAVTAGGGDDLGALGSLLGGLGLDADTEVLVNEDAAGAGVGGELGLGAAGLGAILRRDGDSEVLGGELLDEGVGHETGGPDDETGTDLLVAVLLDLELQLTVLGTELAIGEADALDVVLSADLDLLTPEGIHGILGKSLVEHGENLGGDIVDGDLDELEEVGVHLGKIVVDEIVELGAELDTGRATTDNGEVEEVGAVLIGEGAGALGVGALLEEGKDPQADAAGITNIAEEVGVLTDALDAEGLGVGTASNDELVIGDVEGSAPGGGLVELAALADGDNGLAGRVGVGVGLNADGLVGEVDVLGPTLVEADAVVQAADGLQDGTELESTDGSGGEKGGEDEVGARGDNNALILLGIEVLGEGIARPAGAQDDDPLLSVIVCEEL